MLSNDTRKIIDDARNTLVGQIPVPMMQCQQITLALTYKFMSDDDQTAVDLGGRRHYFTGDLERCSWEKIMSLRLDDTQRSELYRAGLGALQESETMPAVFREIFKDAVVPFGDHRTLALFLNTMDRMVYDDSEKLGDAYEYLLKTAEAQADAGQFRTPRHIIDFIVKIINPQKHEVIIDPACGTAGFLVSAYQHVKSQHELPGGGSSLSVPDLTRLADNLKGYDISPEMTKLAMANMYLHTQNKDPNIDNYDTLTSTDHWNEYADVMLANPPFMTPRGGIKPHTRFRVPATRSEVLFVDYIASHLNEHGRAGVIVPEGIIFQSQNTYRQLRRFLLDESLVAVISLPGGVFNPYSGVKTSILILDKVLAPKTDGVAFFKVENDGYDLGAQRRPIGQDDLPDVMDEISEYLRRLRAEESLDDFEPQTGRLVAKGLITADGEYNLSGERYYSPHVGTSELPTVRLDEVAELIRGITFRKSDQLEYETADSLRVVTTKAAQETGIVEEYLYHIPMGLLKDRKKLLQQGDILVSTANSLNLLGRTTHVQDIGYRASFGAFMSVVRPSGRILDTYLLHCLRTEFASEFFRRNANTTTNISNLNLSALAGFEVPLPPLEVQREIVAEIEGYQRVIDGARQMAASYRPRITSDPEWPMSKLSAVCVVNPRKSEMADMDGSVEVSFVPMADMGENTMYFEALNTKPLRDVGNSYTYFKNDDVLVAKVTPCFENGKAGVARQLSNGVGFGSSEFYVLRHKESVIPEWVYLCVATPEFREWAIPKMTGTGGLQRVPRWAIDDYRIPVPPVDTQRAIVAELAEEQAAVDQAQKLASKMERRIQDAIARVWTAQPDQTAQS